MTIFRENTEDIYAGIEFNAGSKDAKDLFEWLQAKDKKTANKVRFPNTSSFGIKPISQEGTSRLVKSAIEFALTQKRKSLTIVHKGNIMKFTEGGFKTWGYDVAVKSFRNQVITERESWIIGNLDAKPGLSTVDNAKMVEPGFDMMTPGQQKEILDEVDSVVKSIYSTHGQGKWKKLLMVKDSIADITLQQVLTRAAEFDVIATMNLNGDYLSDALAAQVGGIGIAPGGNINYVSGHAIFEATHGTAPKYANKDQVNPGSVILSGEMMFRHLGWNEAADLIIKGMDGAIGARTVTYDFHRLMKSDGKGDVKLLKCSEFGQAIINHM